MALPTFEGKISIEALLQAYPEVDMERDPVLERVALIKAEARPKRRYGDQWLPEPEVLMSRLQDFQNVLVRTKAALNTAEQLLGEMAARLEAAHEQGEADLRATVKDLGSRLRRAKEKSEAATDGEAELFAKDALLRIVSASARILPSGHEFFVEGRDSLLDAALKSGLHLNYGCSSGNCGACKVRVRSGKVRRIREHDFVLSAQELQDGYVLACSNTPVTDVVLEASEALNAADLPRQRIRCMVRKVEVVSEGLVLVRVQTPRTQTLRFMAGQWVDVITEEGLSRALPVASCPCDARNLQFLLRPAVEDAFVQALLSRRKDQTVLIEGPDGEFLLEEEANDPGLFVAVGDGFAPVKSLIEHAIAIDNASRLQLYLVDAAEAGGYLGNLCRAWKDSLDNFDYRRLTSGAGPEQAMQAVLGDFPQLEQCYLYVAAPPSWVEAFAAAAEAGGTLGPRLRIQAV
jgi:CDP-4-dehydro-6-deoxyglucose reductase